MENNIILRNNKQLVRFGINKNKFFIYGCDNITGDIILNFDFDLKEAEKINYFLNYNLKDEIDYKQLWFELCYEKQSLQKENYRLKEDSKYWRKEASKLEKVNIELKKILNKK